MLMGLLGGLVGCCSKSQITSPLIWNEAGFSRSPLHQWLVEVENDVTGWSLSCGGGGGVQRPDWLLSGTLFMDSSAAKYISVCLNMSQG